MPNGDYPGDDTKTMLAKARSELGAVRRELEQVRKQRNMLAANASETSAQLQKAVDDCRSDASLVVHALNCAVQLTEALIAFTPDNSPLHPNVATCQHQLQLALQTISRRTLERAKENARISKK